MRGSTVVGAGEEYYQILEGIHRNLYPRTYLEIGVNYGLSAGLALAGTKVVGVDPNPSLVVPLPSGSVIERCTSDTFFESERASRHFGARPIDLAFIDGMHLWEFALRDFRNIERWAHPGTVVLVHDVMPRTAREAARTRPRPRTSAWTGDVWRAILFLMEQRPDLDVKVIDVAPTGLAVIRNLNPNHPWPEREDLHLRYAEMPHGEYERRYRPAASVISSDWGAVRTILPPDLFLSSR